MTPRKTLAIAVMMVTAAAPLAADAHGNHEEKHDKDPAGRAGNVWFGDRADESRTWLGVTLQRVSGDLAEALDLKEDTGVLVGQVVEGSPAEKAGLESGDVVLSIDGKKVSTPDTLQEMVRARAAGDEIKVRVNRDGREKTLKAMLAEREPEVAGKPGLGWLEKRHFPRELRFNGSRGYLGVVTQELSGDLAEYFGAGEGGALVSEVMEDSPAATLGLRAGDVIVSVGDAEIDGPSDLRREVGKQDGESDVEIVWVRDKREQRGQVTMEMREAEGMFGLGEGGPRMEWFGKGSDGDGPDGRDIRRMLLRLDEDGNRQLVKRFQGADEEGVRELMEELRAEIEALREEVQGLKDK